MRAGEVVGEGRVEEGGVLFSDKRKSATPNREAYLNTPQPGSQAEIRGLVKRFLVNVLSSVPCKFTQ